MLCLFKTEVECNWEYLFWKMHFYASPEDFPDSDEDYKQIINILRTKLDLSELKSQRVPRSKHTPPRL
jgi:hypothetical protein